MTTGPGRPFARVSVGLVRSFRVGLAAVLLAACGTAPSAAGPAQSSAPPGSARPATVTQADVQRAVDDLAHLGIETRIRPSDAAPITPAVGARSPVRLLRFQVGNLALEQAAGGGTRGVDLDAVTAAAGGGPISQVIAGWAASGKTPASTWAASALRGASPDHATATVFPSLVLLAFVADAQSGSRAIRAPSARLVVASDYCADVSAYLSTALGEIVDARADPPQWLKALIDLYAPQYATDPALLRKTIGAVALLAYATSLARPWAVSLVPDPEAVAYGVEGQDPVEADVNLTVFTGQDTFGSDVADCAALADAQVASIPVKDSAIVWDVSGLDGHAQEASADPQVDGSGAAQLSYTTTSESQDVAANGDPVTTQMSVGAWVDRAEMAALAGVVKSILLGDAAGTPAGSTAKALYLAMESKLNAVMRPSGFALIDVTYHTPKASPSPSQAEASLTGTWDGTWQIDPPYADVAGAFTMELVQKGSSLSGTVEITNTDCSNGTVEGTVNGTNVTFGWVLTPQPVQFTGTVGNDSMSGTWSSLSCSSPSVPLTGTWQAQKR